MRINICKALRTAIFLLLNCNILKNLFFILLSIPSIIHIIVQNFIFEGMMEYTLLLQVSD